MPDKYRRRHSKRTGKLRDRCYAGIHWMTPDNVRIVKRMYIDPDTGEQYEHEQRLCKQCLQIRLRAWSTKDSKRIPMGFKDTCRFICNDIRIEPELTVWLTEWWEYPDYNKRPFYTLANIPVEYHGLRKELNDEHEQHIQNQRFRLHWYCSQQEGDLRSEPSSSQD